MVSCKTLDENERGKRSWRVRTGTCSFTVLMVFLIAALVSCSSFPFAKSNGAIKTQGVAKVEERAPRPGDTKVVDGVEFEYVRNVLYATDPYQPEYIWEKKVRYGN